MRSPAIYAFFFLISAFCILNSPPLSASEPPTLSVDKRLLSADDTVVITLHLADAFARINRPTLPLGNLAVDREPSESNEFAWVNGVTSNRKTIVWTARPRGPGDAQVGPLTLRAPGGEQVTLPAIPIRVMADAAAQTNDPLRILHELIATGRDPIFIVAESDKQQVWTGEEVVVTWTLYNASNVQQYGISDIPKLADFWTEELDVRDERPEQTVLGGMLMQKLVIRRAALFPLRSGSLTVDPMSINAAVMKRVRGNDPFGLFEGSLVDVRRRSSPLRIDARPLPPGPPVAAVGEVNLKCGTPAQKNGGPVIVDVTMNGRANLRGAPPPAWERAVDGSVQIVGGAVTADRRRGEAVMTRKWRYLLFPAHAGVFTIPPLSTAVLTPAGVRQMLRCDQRTLIVQAVDAAAEPPPAAASEPSFRDSLRRSLPLIALAGALLILVAVAAPRVQRSFSVRRELRALLAAEDTRAAVDAWLAERGLEPAALLRETSDRGDAYRALRSLLDASDRIDFDRKELRQRLKEVL